jgi:hypothetical protein
MGILTFALVQETQRRLSGLGEPAARVEPLRLGE